MTNENKPTSKVIQISTTTLPEVPQVSAPCFFLTALCEDGSIWERFTTDKTWHCILEANTNAK